MDRFRRCLRCVMILPLLAGPLLAGPLLAGPLLAEESAEPAAARELLRRAGEAAEATRKITYDYTYTGKGSLAGSFIGSVKILKGDSPGASSIWAELRTRPGAGGMPIDRVIVGSGGGIRVVDRESRTFSHGTQQGGAGHLLSYAYYAVLFQYLMPNPFAPELGGEMAEREGTETVNGVECDVVRATNNSYGGADVRWSLGREDLLPRAQDWTVTTPGVVGGFRFEVSNLDAAADLAEEDFALVAPAGYKEVNEDERTVGVGDPAPDWQLRAPDGKLVALSGLEGQIVVLDFWASWCPPCWQLMPEFDKVARENRDRPVRFFGVNSWESPDVDPAAFLADKGVSYPLLLGGETITSSYKIGTLPALFVIGPDGRIAYAANPVPGDLAAVTGELRKVIAGLGAPD